MILYLRELLEFCVYKDIFCIESEYPKIINMYLVNKYKLKCYNWNYEYTHS